MRRKTPFRIGLVLVFVGCLSMSTAFASTSIPSRKSNAAVYDFTASTIDGKKFFGTSLQGKPSVLWFWAPWCTICRGESPDLVSLAKAFKGKINIVGVASLGPVGDMKKFVRETQTGLFSHIADPSGQIWSRFKIVSQPAFIFISKSGAVYRLVGSPPKSDLFSFTKEIIKHA
jgi:thiol-disulfide isomerase/thioredoxin